MKNSDISYIFNISVLHTWGTQSAHQSESTFCAQMQSVVATPAHNIKKHCMKKKNCKVNELLLIVKGRERESNGWFIQYCVLNVMCDRWYLAGTCEFGKTDQELKSYGKLKPTSVLQLMVLTWITSTLGTLCLVFVLSMLLASHKCCICLWQE